MDNHSTSAKNFGMLYHRVTWDEVKKHSTRDDKWIVLDGMVYDITSWAKNHPGGAKIISHFAGEDATDAWVAFHKDREYTTKFLKPLLIGEVTDHKESVLQKDFHQLRHLAEKAGWFQVNLMFFGFWLLQILLLEVMAYAIILHCGTGWLPWVTVAMVLCTSQAQSGWLQHDLGHLSVLKTRKSNLILHYLVIGCLKGASSHWWNFRHNQHHAKPNVLKKDPDITMPYVFLIGDKIAREWGERRRGIMPYTWQHVYFFILAGPLLLPIYFHLENVYFVLKRRDWLIVVRGRSSQIIMSPYMDLIYGFKLVTATYDLASLVVFFFRFFYIYSAILGGWGAFGLYMFMRFLESHWFTWVTQMNHIPMDVDRDQHRDWFTQQLNSSCNIASNWFNDWATGHLNYQIEHHLFPTMPRHNYHKVKPFVLSLCKKHNIKYQCKASLWIGLLDIVRVSIHQLTSYDVIISSASV